MRPQPRAASREQLLVEGLREARVDHGGGDAAGLERARPRRGALATQLPRATKATSRPATQQLAAADRERLRVGIERRAGRRAAREAQREGQPALDRGGEQVLELVLVARRRDHEVRDRAQVGEVEGAVVGRAVAADEPGAVEHEGDRQLLERDVVDDLVEGALQERRVDRADRAQALAREARGEGHGVLLGDADVVDALRMARAEAVEAGAVGHRRGDRHHPLVAVGEARERVGEGLGPGRRPARRRAALSGGGVEGGGGVPAEGIGLGRREAAALARAHVQHARTRRRRAARRAPARSASRSCPSTGPSSAGRAPRSSRARRPVRARPPTVGAIDMPLSLKTTRSAVAELSGVVQRLEGHPRGRAAVADHRHRARSLAAARRRLGHAERGGDRGAGVPGAERVVGALGAAQEAARTVGVLHAEEGRAPPGERLVRVALVADVPDQPVARRVEDVVERDASARRRRGCRRSGRPPPRPPRSGARAAPSASCGSASRASARRSSGRSISSRSPTARELRGQWPRGARETADRKAVVTQSAGDRTRACPSA